MLIFVMAVSIRAAAADRPPPNPFEYTAEGKFNQANSRLHRGNDGMFDVAWKEVVLSEAIHELCDANGWSLEMAQFPRRKVTLSLRRASGESVMASLCALGGLYCHRSLGGGWRVSREPEIAAFHYVCRYQEVDDLAAGIKQGMKAGLSKRGRYYIDNSGNGVWVYDVKSQLPRIGAWLKTLDVPAKQVKVQAFLVNIDNDYIKELGMALRQAGSDSIGGIDFNLGTGSDVTGVQDVVDHEAFQLHLAALERHGQAKVLSSPSITLLNHHEASITVGEEVPYQAMTAEGGTHYDFKDVSLHLTVRVDVLPSDQMRLSVKLAQDHISDTAIHGAHSIETSHLSTTVLLKCRQTLILGGMWYEGGSNHKSGVPAGKFHWLQSLFSGESDRRSQHRMLIFITPTVVP